jgi:hypothetical protein
MPGPGFLNRECEELIYSNGEEKIEFSGGFVQVQSNSQEALMAEEEEMDNSWFSLSLGGGGRNGIDSALPSHIPSSPSQEVYGPPLKARGGLDTISSTGLSWL